MNCFQNKRGQVTLFIIISIVIVALGLLIYFLYPKLISGSEFDTENPEKYIQFCVQEDLENIIYNLSLQGGTLTPSNYYLFQDNQIEYLCYTNKEYAPCIVQKPFLRNSIEDEINLAIKSKVDECFEDAQEKYIKKSYSVELKKGKIITELLPERVLLNLIDYELTVTKEGNTNKFNSFYSVLNNNLYELVSIATNMVEWETTIGEADVLGYMLIYNNLRIQKLKQDDDTKIYILEDKDKETKFQFASRSLAFPPGY